MNSQKKPSPSGQERLDAMLRLPTPPVSTDFNERLLHRLKEDTAEPDSASADSAASSPRILGFPLWRSLSGLGLAALVLLGFFLLLPQPTPNQGPLLMTEEIFLLEDLLGSIPAGEMEEILHWTSFF